MWTGYSLILFLIKVYLNSCAEFTFNLNNAETCYFKTLEKGTKTKIDFQVITGGNYDVDVIITAPHSAQPIEHFKQKQFESYEWESSLDGTHKVCFSNEFSSSEQKTVYFDWSEGDDDQFGGHVLDPAMRSQYPLTRMESSTEVIHENFNEVEEYQTHYRVAEASGRIFAEELNNKVMILSLSLTLAVLIIGIGQIIVLRNFFTEKKTSGTY